jgi:ubiquitin C-terminal hydrolase
MVFSNGLKIYELVGIIYHSGISVDRLYSSYVRVSENKWMEFNDSSVSEIQTENIKNLNGC